ncbi:MULTISPECIES: hypothetical protein [Robiginitalea]|uniref:Uncharacterized protein n=1 Tax=Robiginitalea biformata (strain ATCC BAA-864 / DSM 15991 / KCTC 12146 / HTCC2501) TaxID=313596 RepID=A4CJZ2_ROBBH|nr:MULTISPECIES: hypothetical protein [Robiginitalea]EAR17250.1 hypothetical protein RB2501_10110 [Robiginitalea biformata HTCC2501]MDC6355459.1 hypothetical protein [Robiginitalea sp. PM2]MDC6375931.1 hypothetical protein [Robiginitalea sp. SP8]
MKRIAFRALIGAVFFYIFKLVLGGVYTPEAFFREAKYALAFGVFYAVFLLAMDRFGKNKKRD